MSRSGWRGSEETPEDDGSGEAAMAYRAEGRDRLS